MLNKNLLLSKMVALGYTQESTAKAIGKSKNNFNDKVNGKRPFNADEILSLCDVLKIPDNEILCIFLNK